MVDYYKVFNYNLDMLITNTTAEWTKKADGYTASGEAVMGSTETIPVASVRLREGVKASESNAGSSASHGAAEEVTVVARILIPSRYEVTVGDKLVIGNVELKCSLVWPHYNNFGGLDHFEIDGVSWA